jgi:Flp pilus assembly pilin Flp
MFGKLRRFKKDEDGAVTVDWVVLTAGAAFVGVTVVTAVLNASTDVSNGIGAKVTENGNELLGSP